MIIYEVTTTIQPEFIEEYEKYMQEKHIPELLATGCFSGTIFSRSGEGRYRIQYQADSQEPLDKYLKTDAGRLRADFLAHFPNAEAAREVWTVLQILKG